MASLSRRGRGGIAFLWRKNLDACIEILEDLGDDRIATICIKTLNGETLFLTQVYLPTTSELAIKYRASTNMLENIISQLRGMGTTIILGDFNAHIGVSGGPRSYEELNTRGAEIATFMETFELLSLNSQSNCVGPVETFYSNGGKTKTTLDHIMIAETKAHCITQCSVLEECSENMSFHYPISCTFRGVFLVKPLQRKRNDLRWEKLKDKKYLLKYQNAISDVFQNEFCDNERDNIVDKIEGIVKNTVDNLKKVARSVVPIRKTKGHLKRYWNTTLTSLNKSVKRCWKLWTKDGKPRGPEYDSFANYKEAKREFRKAQRQAVYEEEVKGFNYLEKEFDVDRSAFFRKVSKLKHKSSKNVALKVDGKRIDNEDELLEIWRKHYEDLYCPRNYPKYDDEFKVCVESKLKEYLEESIECEDPLDDEFEIQEVSFVCLNLPNGKSGGLDELTYEHLKYGGIAVFKLLTIIFNLVRELEYVPDNWRVGNIISLFKGGKKDKHNKSNYRGITLLNVIGKVFERVVLNRLMPVLQTLGVPNSFQFAYQKSKSCVSASFVLQEMINYNIERNSKVYCCFMDSSKAFDTVWLDGLFYKLFTIGIKGKTWRILRTWYENMHCCVSLNDKRSTMFSVKQGVRQGGVLSPWLFLCFNNDIPSVLDATQCGLNVYGINGNSVLVADDVTLLSLQVSGLQHMINTMHMYSHKWRFDFNPDKTVVVTFGESTQMNMLRKSTRQWTIKDVSIKETTTWEHVGVTLSGNFSSYKRSLKATKKGKAVVGTLMNAGFRPGGINPICGASAWKCSGLPAMLYGCELWWNITATEEEILNRVNAFAAKCLQGLSPTTHTAGALGSIGMWTTMAHINKTKLLFFGSLCRTPPEFIHKKIFISRLFSYLNQDTCKTLGFIPDIVEILKKYNLFEYLETYLQIGNFPTKPEWKNIVTETVHQNQCRQWKEEMLNKPNLERLMRMHVKLKPIVHWEVARRNPLHRIALANLVNLICGNVPTTVFKAVKDCGSFYECNLCKREINDIIYHSIMLCPMLYEERNDLWEKLTDRLPVQVVATLNNLDDEDCYETLLSGNHFVIRRNKMHLDNLLILVANSVIKCFEKLISIVNKDL